MSDATVTRLTPREVLSAGASPTAGGAQAVMASSAAVYRPGRKPDPQSDRNEIAKRWQVEAYRHIHLCGEARYAVSLFANLAARAEIGVSEPQALARKAVWVESGAEVEALAELAPTVRERTKLIRDYMTHRIIAGECYLIARDRKPNDPGYIPPPNFDGTWEEYLRTRPAVDLLDPDDAPAVRDPNTPIWEIVAVTELRKIGENWEVRYDNNSWLPLNEHDPVIRMWNPDPNDRREAWSPFRSMLPTLREIEWLTMHIFTQVRSRMMSAGVWFLPNNLTFAPPPPEAVEGGAEAIALMNEAEAFMASLAASSMDMLDADEVSFPTVVMSDAAALEAIDQKKLIQFWSAIDDKAMTLRSDAIRRFALGMDLTPEQTLGSSGIAVSGTSGSAGSVNHWGEWANEEKTIAGHIEPALDDFVSTLTSAFLRPAVDGTDKVIGYNPSSIRMKQDRSKEALAWYQEGVLKADVALREAGFDPENDLMDAEERKMWLLTQLVKGSLPPEQVSAILQLLTGVKLPVAEQVSGNQPAPKGLPGPALPRNTDDYPERGVPKGDHEHKEAPFSALHASCEGLVLRALDKAGNRLLNDGKRGRDKDRTTPTHLAHLSASVESPLSPGDFDLSTAPLVLDGLPAARMTAVVRGLALFCYALHQNKEPYTREALIEAVNAL